MRRAAHAHVVLYRSCRAVTCKHRTDAYLPLLCSRLSIAPPLIRTDKRVDSTEESKSFADGDNEEKFGLDANHIEMLSPSSPAGTLMPLGAHNGPTEPGGTLVECKSPPESSELSNEDSPRKVLDQNKCDIVFSYRTYALFRAAPVPPNVVDHELRSRRNSLKR